MGLVTSMTGLPARLAAPRQAQRFRCRRAFDRQDDQFGEFGRVGKTGDARLRVFRRPFGELVRLCACPALRHGRA